MGSVNLHPHILLLISYTRSISVRVTYWASNVNLKVLIMSKLFATKAQMIHLLELMMFLLFEWVCRLQKKFSTERRRSLKGEKTFLIFIIIIGSTVPARITWIHQASRITNLQKVDQESTEDTKRIIMITLWCAIHPRQQGSIYFFQQTWSSIHWAYWSAFGMGLIRNHCLNILIWPSNIVLRAFATRSWTMAPICK